MRRILTIFMFSYLFAGLPDYYYKLSVKEQKREFKKILLPMIEKENQKILKERDEVIQIFKEPTFMLERDKIIRLSQLAKKYKIKDIYDKEEFLKKIDVIPPRLILAQGAVESAWGRSHFVKEANNIFGQWDYSGKGLVPRRRDANATHTIRVFSSLEESLAVYMRNLNRNPAYKEFRELRYRCREENKTFSAEMAVTTLHRYSELGQKYVQILKTIVKQF